MALCLYHVSVWHFLWQTLSLINQKFFLAVQMFAIVFGVTKKSIQLTLLSLNGGYPSLIHCIPKTSFWNLYILETSFQNA